MHEAEARIAASRNIHRMDRSGLVLAHPSCGRRDRRRGAGYARPAACRFGSDCSCHRADRLGGETSRAIRGSCWTGAGGRDRRQPWEQSGPHWGGVHPDGRAIPFRTLTRAGTAATGHSHSRVIAIGDGKPRSIGGSCPTGAVWRDSRQRRELRSGPYRGGVDPDRSAIPYRTTTPAGTTATVRSDSRAAASGDGKPRREFGRARESC